MLFFPKKLNDGKGLADVTNLFEIGHFLIYRI